MATKKTNQPSEVDIAAARQRAAQARQQFEHRPGASEVLTAQEADDAAPFYFVLREFIRQLKEAREAAGLKAAEVAARSGLAVESLSRLETGAQTNPTWKTLGLYARAVGCRPKLTAEPVVVECEPATPRRDVVSGVMSQFDGPVSAGPLARPPGTG